MAVWLKQNTAKTLPFGPFQDEDEPKTLETGLTIGQGDIQISKNGGAFAQTSDSTPSTSHDADGWYRVPLTATDTNTLGPLTVQIHMSGALPVWREFVVMPPAVFDGMTQAAGTDYMPVDVVQVAGNSTNGTNLGSACSNYDAAKGLSGTRLDANVSSASTHSAADAADAVWNEATADHTGAGSASKALIDVLADTDEMQGDLVDAGRLDAILDAIKDATDDLADGERLDLIFDAIDTATAAIQAVTDNLPDSGALSSLAQAAKLKAYVQLLARSDAAIGADNSTELGEINNNEGTGAGDFDQTADSQEAIADGGGGGGATAQQVWEYDISSVSGAGEAGNYLNNVPDAPATEAKQDTAQTDLDTLTGADGATLATAQGNYAPAKAGDEMDLVDDAITSDKFDESTAYPVKSADTGATEIARTGADGDTMEDLSDQLDAVEDDTGTSGVKVAAGEVCWLVGNVGYDNSSGALEVHFVPLNGKGEALSITTLTSFTLYDYASNSAISAWDTGPAKDGTTGMCYCKKNNASASLSASKPYWGIAVIDGTNYVGVLFGMVA